ncbi:MAG: (2Fe-2S)-binding protein [Chitinophagaceae bacterium]|nr:MAG: (2Fe-2S)-binding protein [Chitinophagaceae bacterium]
MKNVVWNDIKDPSISQLKEFELKKVYIHGKELCIGKMKGEFFAVDNKCPHAGGPFDKGFCTSSGFLVCPLHSYKFNVKTSLCSGDSFYRLKKYPVRQLGESLQVGFLDY